MSNKIYPFGNSGEVAVAASDKVAVWSLAPYKVYQKVGYPNYPDTWDLIKVGAANESYVSSAFSAAGIVRIEAGASDVFYQAGTSAVALEVKNLRKTTAGALNATGTLTMDLMLGGVVTSTTAAAVTATTPTGAQIDASIEIAIGESFDFSAVNTGGANAFTVTAGASGVTVAGLAAVAANTSGTFRVVKTAADTFVIYRI